MAVISYLFSYLMGFEANKGTVYSFKLKEVFPLVDGVSMLFVGFLTACLCISIMVVRTQETTDMCMNWIKRAWIAWVCLSFVNTIFMWIMTIR